LKLALFHKILFLHNS